jgi:hypothetical protein
VKYTDGDTAEYKEKTIRSMLLINDMTSFLPAPVEKSSDEEVESSSGVELEPSSEVELESSSKVELESSSEMELEQSEERDSIALDERPAKKRIVFDLTDAQEVNVKNEELKESLFSMISEQFNISGAVANNHLPFAYFAYKGKRMKIVFVEDVDNVVVKIVMNFTWIVNCNKFNMGDAKTCIVRGDFTQQLPAAHAHQRN